MKTRCFSLASACALALAIAFAAGCDLADDGLESASSEEEVDDGDELGEVASVQPESDPIRTLEPNPPGCNRGAFCAYSGPNQTGTLVIEAQGNWQGSKTVRSIFNNGVPFPGADHVQFDYRVNGVNVSRCVHYNPGPGIYKFTFIVPVTALKVRWRGECLPGEDF